MRYKIAFGVKIQKDISHIKKTDKQSFIKLKRLLEELQEDPFTGVGNPEQLKHELSGFWSRRINKKNRLLYKIDDIERCVHIVSVLGHYGDK